MLEEMGLRVWDFDTEEGRTTGPEVPTVATDQAAGLRPGDGLSPARRARTGGQMPRVVSRSEPLEGERPAGISAMDWAALIDAVTSCTACSLCRSRTQPVFGTGNREARWMVVGEAPGEQEDLRGEPFVGKSGQLLDSMLRAVGLSREASAPARQVYIANTLKCRPPGNRNPEPGELLQCEPFLIRQIELVRPDIILAMGRFAVQALLRTDEPIGRLRGQVHQFHGVPLVVTYHPAYLLRNPLEKARAWDDLCLARGVHRTTASP